jgi:hypothetical protein
MFDDHQSRDDAQDAQGARRPGREGFGHCRVPRKFRRIRVVYWREAKRKHIAKIKSAAFRKAAME